MSNEYGIFSSLIEATKEEDNKIFKSPEELLKYMDFIEYDPHKTDSGKNRWRLRSPEQVQEEHLGDCHDQSNYEVYWLKKMGYKPKRLFMIEYKGDKIYDAGSTHTIVYYEKSGKFYWIEHAWGDEAGIHGSYKDLDELKADIQKRWPLNKTYPKFYIGPCTGVKPGMDLEEYVVKCIPKNLLGGPNDK